MDTNALNNGLVMVRVNGSKINGEILINGKNCKSVKRIDNVLVGTINNSEYSCEFKKNSIFYLLMLWAVSLWAGFTNGIQIFCHMICEKVSFKQALWEIGRNEKHVSCTLVDRFSHFNHQGKHGAAGWKSLKLFYNYETEVLPIVSNPQNFKERICSFLTRFWIGKMENRQAVTNRLKIVVNLLADIFYKVSVEKNKKEIKLLSIASGSAQAVLDAMKKHPNLNFIVVLIDNDQSAIDEAKRNVVKYSLPNASFSFVLGTTSDLEREAEKLQPDIIEMVGFLDYRPQAKAKELIARIHNCLPVGGYFMTCNIKKNREMIFLPCVLLWPMIYRTEEEFVDVVLGGNFLPEKTNIYYEPHEIHGIAYCQK